MTLNPSVPYTPFHEPAVLMSASTNTTARVTVIAALAEAPFREALSVTA
jgi:hypothetical protein